MGEGGNAGGTEHSELCFGFFWADFFLCNTLGAEAELQVSAPSPLVDLDNSVQIPEMLPRAFKGIAFCTASHYLFVCLFNVCENSLWVSKRQQMFSKSIKLHAPNSASPVVSMAWNRK